MAKDNIRANIVAPGAIETDINRELRDNKVDQVLRQIPIGELQSQMM